MTSIMMLLLVEIKHSKEYLKNYWFFSTIENASFLTTNISSPLKKKDTASYYLNYWVPVQGWLPMNTQTQKFEVTYADFY